MHRLQLFNGHQQLTCFLIACLTGEAKHRNSWMKEIVLGFMAGAFICFGFATCMIAAGQVRSQQGQNGPW